MEHLVNWCADNKISTPIKLEIGLVKLINKGTQKRYLRVYIEGHDVTQMVANAVNLKLSKAKDTYNSLIINGCGMDMGFALQDRVQRSAYKYNPNLFDRDDYIYIGRCK